MDVQERTSRLSRADWITAALEALQVGGLASVSVEPLAKHLGATKGSFYWHFRGREDLIAAALERWEHEGTDDVTAAVDTASGPARRLRALAATTLAGDDRPDLSVVLLPDAGHPLVAAALERVTRRRMDYLTEQLQALGVDEQESRARALLAYTTFLGYSQLRLHLPAALDDTIAKSYLAALDRALLPR